MSNSEHDGGYKWLVGLAALAIVVGVAATASFLAFRPDRSVRGTQSRAQCAHYAAWRCCGLLGVPMKLSTVVEQMPPARRGNSMLQMSEWLRAVGLVTEGRRCHWEELASESYPCIAHLREPAHFVVICGVEHGLVHFFDGGGRRRTTTLSRFREEGTAHVLVVRRSDPLRPLPLSGRDSRTGGPRIQFERCLLDKGEIDAKTQTVEFHYPCENLGSEELVIRTIHSGCKCLRADYPTEPIPPGGRADICLFYKVRAKRGNFMETALVETNDETVPILRLMAAGNTGAGVTIRPSHLNIGEVVCGAKKDIVCFVHYRGDLNDFSINEVSTSLAHVRCHWSPEGVVAARREAAISPNLPPVQTAPGVWRVTLSFAPSATSVGPIEGSVQIRTNAENYREVTVPIKGKYVAPVQLFPGTLCLGRIRPGETIEKSVRVVARAQSPFRIIGVDARDIPMRCSFPRSVQSGTVETTFTFTGSSAFASAERDVTIHLEIASQKIDLPLQVYAWGSKQPSTASEKCVSANTCQVGSIESLNQRQ